MSTEREADDHVVAARYGREMMPEGPPISNAGEDLPSRLVLSLLGDKWTVVVLYCISAHEARRFNELQRHIPDISKKMLVQTLRQLERDGLVERTVYPQVPPKTDYRLTEDGRRMREPIAFLCQWALENRALLQRVRIRRDDPPEP